MSTLRNSQLLQQVGRHPLKSSLAKAFDIAETFQGDVEFLRLEDLTATARQKAMQSKLRGAIRDLRDARAPIGELQKKVDEKRKLVSMPKFDRSDDYGLKLRMELRQTLKTTTDPGQRELLLAKPAYADALLETEPEVSGLFLAEDFKGTISPEIQRDRDIVAAAKKNGWPACSRRGSRRSPSWSRPSPRRARSPTLREMICRTAVEWNGQRSMNSSSP